MNLDVNRLTLDEKISNLEKIKQIRSISTSFIDFDQYPDNYVDFTSDYFIYKVSVDNVGDYYPPWDGFGFKVCLFSPRINGFLFRNVEVLNRITISKVVTLSNLPDFQNVFNSGLAYLRGLFNKTSSIFEKEHMSTNTQVLSLGFLNPVTLQIPFFSQVFTNASGGTKSYIGKMFSLNVLDGTIAISSLADANIGGSPTAYPSIGYSRLTLIAGAYDFSYFMPFDFSGDPNIFASNVKRYSIATVQSVGDLEERFKPLFPVSWSV